MKDKSDSKCQSSPTVRFRKTHTRMALLVVSGALVLALTTMAQTQLGSTFTYQGQLLHEGVPANGLFDLNFKLYDRLDVDPEIDESLDSDTKPSVPVSNGLFTVELDFGSAHFDGDARWIAIGVRAEDETDTEPYDYVLPLQPLTAAPYALFALNSSGGGVPAGAIVMWSGLLADIPSGWALCDGTNGTPDLIDRFVLGVSSGEDPGSFGGSDSHGHSIGGGNHSHTVNGGGEPARLVNHHSGNDPAAISPHSHGISGDASHSHSVGVVTHLPPYFKLALIMKLP